MTDEEKQKEFSNWVYNILALNVTKVALHSFVIDKWDKEIKGWNIKSLNDLLEFLQDVENGKVKVNKTKKKLECLNHHETCQSILGHLMNVRQDNGFTISCKTILGEKIVRNDVKESDAAKLFREVSGNTHVTPSPDKPKQVIGYDHIFPGCKITHIWCIANMFMKSESFKNDICNTCPTDTDAAMFFRMMKNCKLFEVDDHDDLYQKIIEIRNKLHHSEVNRIKTQDSNANLETMKTFLRKFLSARKECEDAIKEIEEMKDRRFLLRDAKKAMFTKMFALETDKKIAKSMGQNSEEIEYLQMEAKEQFKHTEVTQFVTLKTTEEFIRENEMLKEKLDVLMRDHTPLDIHDLEEDLKEQMIKINETLNVKESVKEKEKEGLLSSVRDIKMELNDIRKKRLEVTSSIEENSQDEDFLKIIGNLDKELKVTSKELSDLSHDNKTSSKGNGTDLKRRSNCKSNDDGTRITDGKNCEDPDTRQTDDDGTGITDGKNCENPDASQAETSNTDTDIFFDIDDQDFEDQNESQADDDGIGVIGDTDSKDPVASQADPDGTEITVGQDFGDQDARQTDATTQHAIGIFLIYRWWRCFVAKRDDIKKFDFSQSSTDSDIEDSHRFDKVSFEQLESECFEMIRSLNYGREKNTATEESNSATTDLFKSASDRDTLWVFPFPAGVRESAKERYGLAVKKMFSSDPSGFVLAPDTLLVLKYFMSVPASLLNIDGNVSEAQKKRPFENGTKCMVVFEDWRILTVSTFEIIDSGTIKEIASSVSKLECIDSFIKDVKDGVYQKELGLVDTLVVALRFVDADAIEELRFEGKCIITPKDDNYEEVLVKGGLLYGDSPLSLLKF